MDIVYWIWLSLSVTPGSETFGKLILRFADAKLVYDATNDDIAKVIGSKSKDFRALCDKDLEPAQRICDFCSEKKVGILLYSDPSYPNEFKKLSNPPVLLYYRGKLPDFNKECCVAVVGTRRLTDYGRKNAFRIGYDLASAGAVLVSGMAIGIDGVSHAGSLAANGVNVAFLGSGIDVCYPSQHLTLARHIVATGCILTEYPPHSRPEKYHFPKRNRLIAAIACASVVIEGNERSGSLITARYAKEYGKSVYALPGNVDNKMSEASNLLIKNGAKLITSADDIVADLETLYMGIINPYKLEVKPHVDMENVFSELKVSCVTASDSIFTRVKNKLERRSNKKAEEQKAAEPEENRAKLSPNEATLDSVAIHVYRKIPTDAEISIDELPDEQADMKAVMRALLKLEMGCFITMLPGEKVKRII